MGLQYGIKEVLNLSIVDFATNKPFIYADYAEMSSNENKAERLDLRGGQGHGKVMSFDHTRDSLLKVTMPLVDLKLITLMTGEDLITGAADVFKRETLIVNSSNQVTLATTPVSGSLFVADLIGLRDYGTEITLGISTPAVDTYYPTGNVLKFNATSHPVGSEVVVTYQYASPATSRTISVRTNKFPKAVKIYGTGIARNQEDELDYPVHVAVYKARPQANFTFSMEGTNATKLEINFDLYTVTDADGNQQLIDYVFEGL